MKKRNPTSVAIGWIDTGTGIAKSKITTNTKGLVSVEDVPGGSWSV